MSDRLLTLRITLIAPPAGVLFSLQEGDATPVAAQRADGGDLTFAVTVRVGEGPKGPRFLGPFVRREGERRFVYLRVGRLAGDAGSPWDRRVKLFVTDIPADRVEAALRDGIALAASFPGTMKDGTPVCATVKPVDGWRAA
jgi:hypothetical protein